MRRLIPPDWTLPDAILNRLGEAAGRQRAMHHEGHLLLIAHEPPVAGESERKARLFWRRPDGGWDSSALGGGLQALHRHLDDYAKRIDALENRVEKADDARDYFTALREGTPLQRAQRRLTAALQSAREAVPGDRELITLRDRANDLERAIDLVIEDARLGLEYTVARNAEESARSDEALARAGHRLNLLAALFLPLTAIASVFGMQVEHGLEHRWAPWPFWLILGLSVVIGLVLRGALGKPVRK